VLNPPLRTNRAKPYLIYIVKGIHGGTLKLPKYIHIIAYYIIQHNITHYNIKPDMTHDNMCVIRRKVVVPTELAELGTLIGASVSLNIYIHRGWRHPTKRLSW